MKKTISILFVASICSLLNAPANCKAASQQSQTEITFMISGTGNYAIQRKAELEELLLPAFPDLQITVEAYPEEQYYSLLNTRLSMGEGPDFFNIQPNWAGPNAVNKLAPAGYLEPLDDLSLIQNAPSEDKESVSWNGHTYSLNHFSMILCTYYNKEIFQQLGLAVPQNWPEFLSVCEQLKAAGITPIVSGNKDSYALQFGLYQLAACQIYANIPDYDRQLALGKAALTDPGTWDSVIDRYLLLYKNGYIQDNSLSMGNAEAILHFTNGEAAMLFNGNFSYSSLLSAMGEDALGAFPLPGNDVGQPIYTVLSKGGGMAVYSGGKHVELCKKIWEFLQGTTNSDSGYTDSIWEPFKLLGDNGQYTINCNQNWKGDVEWVLEDGVSRKIGGDSISISYITSQMQKSYEEG